LDSDVLVSENNGDPIHGHGLVAIFRTIRQIVVENHCTSGVHCKVNLRICHIAFEALHNDMHISGLLETYVWLTILLLFKYSSGVEEDFYDHDNDSDWTATKAKENETSINILERSIPESSICGIIVAESHGVGPKYKSTIQLAKNEELFDSVGILMRLFWISSGSTLTGKSRNDSCAFINCGKLHYNYPPRNCKTITSFDANVVYTNDLELTSVTCACVVSIVLQYFSCHY